MGWQLNFTASPVYLYRTLLGHRGNLFIIVLGFAILPIAVAPLPG